MYDMIRKCINTVINAVFPPRCPLCDAFTDVRARPCKGCSITLHVLGGDAHLPALRKIWFSRCRSRFAYEGGIKDSLHNYKYGERLDLAKFLSDELAIEAADIGVFDVIIPVPLHPRKLRSRGFNQSAILARRLGRVTSVKVDLDSLVRVRDIEPQVGLEKAKRVENVKGVFAVNPKRYGYIAGRVVLLIDDVLTTGATINECARALMKADATSVSILTVARTL